MKRKIGLALAVILVGVLVVVYAQTKGEMVEPTSTPVSSSVSASSAPVATEEPAASTEPDSALPQPVNQKLDEGYSNEGAEPVDEDYDAMKAAKDEQWIQDMMSKWNISREEAEAALQKSNEMAAEDLAEMEKNRQEASEEFWKQHEAEGIAAREKEEAYLQERYGLSYEEWCALSSEEQMEYSLTHPWNG